MSDIGSTHLPPRMAQLAIFTGFHGTLVETPDLSGEVEIPSNLHEEIERAAREFESAFAVLTGRTIEDIDRILAPLHLPVAGAHGVQRRRADGTLDDSDAAAIQGAEEIAHAVAPLVMAHPELSLEPREGTVALHYRQAPELEATCRLAMEEAVNGLVDFALVRGDMVIEARPRGAGKGAALRAFMQEEPFAGRMPIVFGDDDTDEEAFIAAQEMGGVGIKLGEGETAARMRIADVGAVHALIRGLTDLAARNRMDSDVLH